MLDSPNPILISQWDGWFIMDKKWCEENNAVAPTPASATTPSYASLHENGTGPFYIESHQPGVKTVFKVNPNWWGKPEHNLKEIDLHADRIGRDARRRPAVGRSRRHRAGSDPGHRSASMRAASPRS